MPAAVVPLQSPSRKSDAQATWSLLEVARPGCVPEPWGILLVDSGTGRLLLRLREETELEGLEEDELDYLAALESDLAARANEPGGGHALLESLEVSLSGFLRIGERVPVSYTGSAARTLEMLFAENVDGEIRPFVTHLPLYGLRAAATKFGEAFGEAESAEPESWLRVPRGLRLGEGMFVAQVVGRSMEPVIPDGSYCIFRGPVTGSRQGRRLLIEQTGGAGAASDRYTVKRYTGEKAEDADGAWRHTKIRLTPLNPEYEAFDLGEGDFRVIAEFVQVLD